MLAEPHVISKGQRLPLSPEAPLTVPAGALLLDLPPDLETTGIWLDGRKLTHLPIVGGRLLATVDMARYTGYHELSSGDRRWLFATDDAKLRLEGIVRMLEFLGDAGLGWSGAMSFSGESRILRDPRLDKAWLDAYVPEIVHLCKAVARSPDFTRDTRYKRARVGVPHVAKTVKFLRQNPHLVEPFPGGPLKTRSPEGTIVDGAPLEAIVRATKTTLDTLANRRAVQLLVMVRSLVQQTWRFAPADSVAREGLDAMAQDLAPLARLEPFASLGGLAVRQPLDRAASPTELHNFRYRRTRALNLDLREKRRWDPEAQILPRRAYVGYADQIFQQFCAHVLATARSLVAVETSDRAVLMFRSDDWEIFSNVTPPATVLADWRAGSSRPAALRPDVAVRNRHSGSAAVLDAKYRADGARASSDSLAESQLYMDAYSLPEVGVMYPLSMDIPLTLNTVVGFTGTGIQKRILEVPIRPGDDLMQYVADEVWPKIELMAQ